MSTTVTLDTVHQRVLQELNQFRSHNAVLTTTGAGSTTSLVVASLAYSSASAYNYDGINVYCPTVTSSPKTSRVTRGGFTSSSGTFVMAPAYGSSPGNAASVYLTAGFDITAVDEAVNDIIRTLPLPRYLPLSLFTDGDMEATGTTSYTAVAGATLAKTTTAGQVLMGKQALKVSVTASGDGMRTASIPIAKSEAMFISVPVKLSDNTKSCQVILYKADEAAALQTATVTGSDWEDVRFNVGPVVENVQVRVLSNTSGSFDIYVGYIAAASNLRRMYPLPSQVQFGQDLDGLFQMPYPLSTQDNYGFVAFSDMLEPLSTNRRWQDYAALTSQRIEFQTPVQGPVFLKFRSPDTVLSQNTGDTGTTVVPIEILVEGATANLFSRLAGMTRDRILKADYQTASLVHSRTYNKLKDAIMGRVEIEPQTSRRVAVP